ncbi:MAG TPA: VOC family protein [Burkholderiales bacterium]|nr:VOC family protein [Burkholderiales bacterium]
MKLLHAMLRVTDVDKTLAFFKLLGLEENRRRDYATGRFTLIFLREISSQSEVEIELTYNWDRAEPYAIGKNFGHLAFEVEDINEKCDELREHGIVIARPPRDGYMAFIRSPDGISIELLQRGNAIEPREPYLSMPNQGEW